MQGTVKFYNDSKGYGFITDDETKTDYFVHSSGVKSKIRNNDKVTFEVGEGKKGPMAVDVQLAQ
ncbi:MAG: cold shock domain-containing protein [Bacteroidota bacterium]|jgi:cold shock protein